MHILAHCFSTPINGSRFLFCNHTSHDDGNVGFLFSGILGKRVKNCCKCNLRGGGGGVITAYIQVYKAIYFSWFGPELFCLLLGPPGFNCWFSSAPVFQWCCSTPQGSPGVGRNTFLSSPHLCFIIVFICDLFVSRDDPLMS